MVRLKPDPWATDHGAGAEASFGDDDVQVVVDTSVETTDWAHPVVPRPGPVEPVIFVDGVMRIDMRVMAEDGEARTWGIFGSYAAGGVRCDAKASFVAADQPVGRVLILGGRVVSPPVTATMGRCEMTYAPRSIHDDTPAGQRRVLQRLMLELEQRTATELSAHELVFADGPLHLNIGRDAEVVGVVKRMVTAYLEGREAALLTVLSPGARTPIFSLGNSMLDRYAWYQRLLPPDSHYHELAGLVRCEVRMETGLEAARSIADRVACLLPRYAGRPGIDPRAPQNLTPVGALEARLRHRLGHPIVVRRALQTRLMEA